MTLLGVGDVGAEHAQFDNRLVKAVDANVHEKRIAYGELGEVLSVADQDGVGQTFEYDTINIKRIL